MIKFIDTVMATSVTDVSPTPTWRPCYLRLAPWYSASLNLNTAWEEGKDFQMLDCGRYCSIRDIESLHKEYDDIIAIHVDGTEWCLDDRIPF